MIIEFDTDLIKEVLNKAIKKSNGEILSFLMGNSVNFFADNNDFIIKVLFLKYRISIEKIPEKASDEFVFKHNLPLDKIDKSQLPEFVKIENHYIKIKIPSNIITDNLIVSTFKMNDDKIFIEFK